MSKLDDMGGPAFPSTDFAVSQEIANEQLVMRLKNLQGMTLWDYYTAAALTGIWAGNDLNTLEHVRKENGLPDMAAAVSVWAGDQASAMLAERAKRFGEDA